AGFWEMKVGHHAIDNSKSAARIDVVIAHTPEGNYFALLCANPLQGANDCGPDCYHPPPFALCPVYRICGLFGNLDKFRVHSVLANVHASYGRKSAVAD